MNTKYPAGALVWTVVEVDGPGPDGTIGLVMTRRYAGATTIRFVKPEEIMARDEIDALRAEMAEAQYYRDLALRVMREIRKGQG